MALPPKFAGQQLLGSRSDPQHTLEIYLDFVCPFSAKMFLTIYSHIVPLVLDKHKSKLRLIFRQHIQPWHPSSTLTHEAAAAVLRLSPDRFWDFAAELFLVQAEYFDVRVVNETRNQTYERLARLAEKGAGVEAEKVMQLLRVSDQPAEGGGLNTGNGVTDDVKRMVKAARVVGVHVSPTVFFDGVEERGISSSFTGKEWEEWLEKNVT